MVSTSSARNQEFTAKPSKITQVHSNWLVFQRCGLEPNTSTSNTITSVNTYVSVSSRYFQSQLTIKSQTFSRSHCRRTSFSNYERPCCITNMCMHSSISIERGSVTIYMYYLIKRLRTRSLIWAQYLHSQEQYRRSPKSSSTRVLTFHEPSKTVGTIQEPSRVTLFNETFRRDSSTTIARITQLTTPSITSHLSA